MPPSPSPLVPASSPTEGRRRPYHGRLLQEHNCAQPRRVTRPASSPRFSPGRSRCPEPFEETPASSIIVIIQEELELHGMAPELIMVLSISYRANHIGDEEESVCTDRTA
uniref:Uncharacterized protein n=1 Tax=Oryza meridionalis TaxID=40149 RepID=A0A0E0DZS3_9ORYZ